MVSILSWQDLPGNLQFGKKAGYDMHQSLVDKDTQDTKEELLCKIKFDKRVVFDMKQSIVH